MKEFFPLTPRYRLDDESPWLEGIDPARNYWIAINGDRTSVVAIPGLTVSSLHEWKQIILRWRSLQPKEQIGLERAAHSCIIHCISENCYAIEAEVNGALIWHLFDGEALDSLLMTSHPDWQSSMQDINLGREILARAWDRGTAAESASLRHSFVNRSSFPPKVE